MFNGSERQTCQRLVACALDEDLGTAGDITSNALLPPDLNGSARIVARQAGVVAGLEAAEMVFAAVDSALVCKRQVEDGASVQPGQVLAMVSGPMHRLLAAERTALNFVQRLSGIATLTRKFVDAIAGHRASILDTRKTTPGWRLLEKYAVRMGGGRNHRLGLHDAFLIKDNHLAALGGDLRLAIERARQAHPAMIIECEVDSLEQLVQVLPESPDIILLDNMTELQLKTAVNIRDKVNPKVQLEASGGIRLENVRDIAGTGVDMISVGALTHSALALDIALDFASKPPTTGTGKG